MSLPAREVPCRLMPSPAAANRAPRLRIEARRLRRDNRRRLRRGAWLGSRRGVGDRLSLRIDPQRCQHGFLAVARQVVEVRFQADERFTRSHTGTFRREVRAAVVANGILLRGRCLRCRTVRQQHQRRRGDDQRSQHLRAGDRRQSLPMFPHRPRHLELPPDRGAGYSLTVYPQDDGSAQSVGARKNPVTTLMRRTSRERCVYLWMDRVDVFCGADSP